MVLDHLLRERLGVRIRLLRERKLARLDLEHVADRDLVHEVLRRWRAGGRRRLGESNRSEERASGRGDQGFVHETLHREGGWAPLGQLMSEYTGSSTACPRAPPIVRRPGFFRVSSERISPAVL